MAGDPALEDRPLAERVRSVHRSFPTGVTVVTACDADGTPHGLAVNAFASVSLDPLVVMACVARSALTHEHLVSATHAAVNFLAHDQQDVAAAFARSGGDKFAQLAWHSGRFGAPLLDGVSAQLELLIESRLPAYTHTMLLGRVVDAYASDAPPLVYLDGGFFDGARLRPAV